MTLAERATEAGYAAGWRLVRALPDGLARKLFDMGADFSASRGGGPNQLRRNLARVLGVPPEAVPDELVQASVRSYARYWREAFRLPSMNLDAQAAVIDGCDEQIRSAVLALCTRNEDGETEERGSGDVWGGQGFRQSHEDSTTGRRVYRFNWLVRVHAHENP